MEATERRPDPYLAGFADGEAGKPMDAAPWVLVAAEWNAYIDGWHVGRASKWGPLAWLHEARPYCPYCGRVVLEPVAAQRLKEGDQDIVCGVCEEKFPVDVQIRFEFSTRVRSDD